MCAACGDTGYIKADELHANTIAIRKWCGPTPQVLVPCYCSPARKEWPWKDSVTQQRTQQEGK